MKYRANHLFILFLVFSIFKTILSDEPEKNTTEILRAFSSDDTSEKVSNPLSGIDYWEAPNKEYINWSVELKNSTYVF
jgi:hypothetical protein